MHAVASQALSSETVAPLFARPPIAPVVQQHADDSAHLRHVRSVLVRAPHVTLLHLKRLDDRLEAHLDGLFVAGRYGQQCAEAALERLGCGEVFSAVVCALQAQDEPALQRLFALAPTASEARRGVLSALAWVAPGLLRNVVRRLLSSTPAWQRAIGIEASRLHRVDPGPMLAGALQHEDAELRRAALRTAGELGRVDLLPAVAAMLDDPSTAPVAARAACLLGDRGTALRWVQQAAFEAVKADDALRTLAVQALDWERAHADVRMLARDGVAARELIRAVGWLGDARLVPWLIEQMADLTHSRVAGEAFTTITGADLAALDLERQPPEDFASGPSDDPADDNVALDDDESLPWPDIERVQRWWKASAARFPAARRIFVGRPVDHAHCMQVLREGTQRQRALAAQHLCLLRPGQALFPVAEPVWRQQRRLIES